ncbi:glycosyltransferase family 2 protein [Candidatus Parcubacteria bacterium]|nr:glycosyltransferase family 2 protein [Candidatus Parcubacteria bacterium]
METKIAVVVPNWNGAEFLRDCLDSLRNQSQSARVVVVDNGSEDESVEIIEKDYHDVILLKNPKNLGFAGGVNTGIRFALENGADMIALFNNDAIADRHWLKHLTAKMESDPKYGIVASKVLKKEDGLIDNTGESFSIWGLPYPRSRDEKADSAESSDELFGASGGSTLYRSKMLESIGLFDERFFAYYEDADMNFRAQLAGWKARYAKKAIVHHVIGGTSDKMGGFTTYQTLKNLPMLMLKDVPLGLAPKMWPRFFVMYCGLFIRALLRGYVFLTFKSLFLLIKNLPHILRERFRIQRSRKVSNEYIWSILYKDLPPNSHKLHKVRSFLTFGKH